MVRAFAVLMVLLVTCHTAGGARGVPAPPAGRHSAYGVDDDWRPAPRLSLWELWFRGGDQVECQPALAALYRSADRVVLGRIEALRVTRVVGHDEASVVLAEARVRVTASLRETGPSRPALRVTFMVAEMREKYARARLEAAIQRLPSADVLLFLRTNRDHYDGDDGTTRLVCDAGLWTDQSDGVRAPLLEGGEDEAMYRPELHGVASVADLGRRLHANSSP